MQLFNLRAPSYTPVPFNCFLTILLARNPIDYTIMTRVDDINVLGLRSIKESEIASSITMRVGPGAKISLFMFHQGESKIIKTIQIEPKTSYTEIFMYVHVQQEAKEPSEHVKCCEIRSVKAPEPRTRTAPVKVVFIKLDPTRLMRLHASRRRR